MFNKQELDYLYMAVNALPAPNNIQGGKAKAFMINKLCDLMDELEAKEKAAAKEKPDLKEVKGGEK